MTFGSDAQVAHFLLFLYFRLPPRHSSTATSGCFGVVVFFWLVFGVFFFFFFFCVWTSHTPPMLQLTLGLGVFPLFPLPFSLLLGIFSLSFFFCSTRFFRTGFFFQARPYPFTFPSLHDTPP